MRLQTARRHHWLRGIPGKATRRANALKSLGAARNAVLQEAAFPQANRGSSTASRRKRNRRSRGPHRAAVGKRYFEPERDWRLIRGRGGPAPRAGTSPFKSCRQAARAVLVGAGRSASRSYVMHRGDEVRLWYQTWPRDFGRVDTRRRSFVLRGPLGSSAKPDIVIQRITQRCETVDEPFARAQSQPEPGGTLGGGLLQLLGYLKDRPSLVCCPAGGLARRASLDGIRLQGRR